MADFRIDKREIDFTKDAFKNLKKDLNKFNSNLTKSASSKILKLLRHETPKDTGETSTEWRIKTQGDNGFELTNGRGGIIKFLMDGVNPHKIEPKNKSVLVAKIGGSIIFAKFVNHPGYEPQMDEKMIFDKIKNIIIEESKKIIVKNLKNRFSN